MKIRVFSFKNPRKYQHHQKLNRGSTTWPLIFQESDAKNQEC